MKRLYLSDLDGTLFTTKKTLTETTVRLLNESIEKGALFGVATARMPYGCDYRLTALHINAPSILTNGVFLYDFAERSFLSVKTVPIPAVLQVLEVFRRFHTGVFLYTFAKDNISLYYNLPEMTAQTQYYSDKALASCGEVRRREDLEAAASEAPVVYLACTGSRETLEPLCEEIQRIDGIACAFYLNIYNGLYCIEIFSDTATKRNALLELKEMLGCDEVVVFGDNLNDLSMFEVAERSYAVENALDAAKQNATGVIASCNEDGVAVFIHDEVCKGGGV